MVWPFRSHDPTPFMPVTDPGPKKEDLPQFVPMERFTAALDEVKGLNSKLDQFTGLLTGMLGTQPGQQTPPQPPAQEPAIDDITDDDYADAVLKGDAARITKRTKAEVERARRDIKKDYDARFARLEGQGMGILDQVNTELGQHALGSMPYYQLLKADVDAALKQLPAHQRTPEMRAHIYHAVVGANEEKVYAHRRAEEARIAKEREALDTPGRGKEQSQGPTPSTVFGDELLKPTTTWRGGAGLWSKRSPDQWAQARYGVENIQQAAIYASNVLALDDCPRCFGPIIGGTCHCRGKAA